MHRIKVRKSYVFFEEKPAMHRIKVRKSYVFFEEKPAS
jgi:hypothetical protein